MTINFAPVTEENLSRYITVGIQSYREHYEHLWQQSDPTPFIEAYLTKTAVKKALTDPNQLFYLITTTEKDIGILNITLNSKKGFFLSANNLLLNKIYLLKAYSAIGVGSKTLQFVYELAVAHQKDVVWLYAMKKGKPIQFYKKHGYTIIKEAEIELPKVLDEEKEMWLMAKKMDNPF